MRQQYSCPECSQLFSRRWNLREHCRTQHGYDPFPIVKKTDTTTSANVDTKLNMTQKKLGEAVSKLLRYQELETAHKTSKEVLDIVVASSASSTIDFILDNYAIINRHKFSGLSGFLCYNCLTFQFEYIKDMGFDLIAQKRHRCLDAAVKQATFIGRGSTRLNEIILEAVNHMTNLTEFLFRGQKFLLSQPIPHANSDTYPVLDSITLGDLLSNAINKGKIPLTHEDLEEFIKLTFSTYAVFPLAGAQYCVYVTSRP